MKIIRPRLPQQETSHDYHLPEVFLEETQQPAVAFRLLRYPLSGQEAVEVAVIPRPELNISKRKTKWETYLPLVFHPDIIDHNKTQR